MHDCLSIQDWIRAWGDPDGAVYRFAECERCWPLRGDAAAWVTSVRDCEACTAALDASPVTDDVMSCPACLDSFNRMHELVEGLEHYDPSVVIEILAADELRAKLDPMPLSEKVARVTDDIRYQQWALTQQLLDASYELRFTDRTLSHEHAKVAVTIADRLDAATYNPLWVADLRAKAHAYLANAHRILGDFQEAEREFITAEVYSERGTRMGRAVAAVFYLKASLLLDQRRFFEAGSILEVVMNHRAAVSDTAGMACTCLKLAAVEDGRENFEGAAAMCARALAHADPDEDRRLWTLAKQNAAYYKLLGGDIPRARRLFNSLPPVTDRDMEHRRYWIEANLLRAEDESGAAAVAYQAARRGFLEDERHYYAALVALDESAMALGRGEHFDAVALAQEASILLVKGAAREEALALFRVLLTAMERGTADRALVLTMARRIARLNPA